MLKKDRENARMNTKDIFAPPGNEIGENVLDLRTKEMRTRIF